MQERIMIVEDDQHISKLLKYNLEKAGFSTILASDGEQALGFLNKQAVDLIILDIMLPKIDGFEACRLIKQDPKIKNIPIIMLTAKSEEVDRIVGLELGADDYVIKPFSPRELILRIKAILKRGITEISSEGVLEAGKIHIDIARHSVQVNKRDVGLTPMEFRLLVTLIERKGRIQSRAQLLADVWDMRTEALTRTVDTHIKRLREKLGIEGSKIETIRGLGYRFIEE